MISKDPRKETPYANKEVTTAAFKLWNWSCRTSCDSLASQFETAEVADFYSCTNKPKVVSGGSKLIFFIVKDKQIIAFRHPDSIYAITG